MKNNISTIFTKFLTVFLVGISVSLYAQQGKTYDELMDMPAHTYRDLEQISPEQMIKLNISNYQDKNITEKLIKFPNLLWLEADSCDNESLGGLDWSKLKNLKHLSLGNNKIKKISPQLFELKSLEFLNLSFNEIQVLPENIEHLCNLRYLNLSYNKLKKLPENIGALTTLLDLYLHNNDFEELPESFIKLKYSLAVLNISSTKLRTLPAYLINFRYRYEGDYDEQSELLAADLKNIKYLPEEKNLNFNDVFVSADYLMYYKMYSWILSTNSIIALKKDSLISLDKEIERACNTINNNAIIISKQQDSIQNQYDIISETTKAKKKLSIKLFVALSIITLCILLLFTFLFFLKKLSKKNKQIHTAYSDLKDMHLKLQQTTDELEESSAKLFESQKKAFISDMVVGLAHDLKTPIGSTKLFSSTLCALITKLDLKLKEQELSESDLISFRNKSFEIGELIYSDMNRVAEWIDSFQTITADQVRNELKTIQLKEYLELCVQTLSYKLQKEKISYSILAPENLCISTHPGFISQVILNLVNNAIEHGFNHYEIPDKKISIFVDKKEEELIINCNNNGRPVPPDILPKIFDDYFSTQKGIKGMGLSNVKRIVEQGLEGNIRCESDESLGVTFTITFPIKSSDNDN